MRSYTQLAQEQRYQIYALKKAGHMQERIAVILGVHKSTISRELRRNRGKRGYRPQQAHRLAMKRHQDKSKPRISLDLWALVERLVGLQWSPEQISGWLLRTGKGKISHEWIYQYILADKRAGGSLYRNLRCQKKRKKRYGTPEHRGRIPNRRSIEERPAIVDTRVRIGDWELDTIISKGRKQAIVSLTERKARLALIAKVQSRDAKTVSKAIQKLLLPLRHKVHTLTSDNGREFTRHEEIAAVLEAEYYFTHPYSAWERGTNENTNGLIRQYFSKNRDFATIASEEIKMAMNRLNNRPRKCLGYHTPNEVFFGTSKVALTS